MEFGKSVFCRKCHQPITPAEDSVCFKSPRKEIYEFFQYRFRGGDCWEQYVQEAGKRLAGRRDSKTVVLVQCAWTDDYASERTANVAEGRRYGV